MNAEEHQQWIAQGAWLFSQQSQFIAGVARIEQLIPESLPEVAFIGRSNVGKSSLLNALTGRNSLARTSRTPGCTRQINFFKIGEHAHLVDVPGYGFAKVSHKESARWIRLIHDYMRGRVSLRRAALLIDSRHGLKASDREMMDFLDDLAVPYQVILTKIDKISAKELEETCSAVRAELKKHAAALPEPVPTSAEKKLGIEEYRADLAAAFAI